MENIAMIAMTIEVIWDVEAELEVVVATLDSGAQIGSVKEAHFGRLACIRNFRDARATPSCNGSFERHFPVFDSSIANETGDAIQSIEIETVKEMPHGNLIIRGVQPTNQHVRWKGS